MADRVQTLRSRLEQAEIDVAAVVPGANLRYLTGLELHGGIRLTLMFFPVDGTPALVLPRLEQPRAEAQARTPIKFYPWSDGEGPYNALQHCVDDLAISDRRIGVEHTVMRVFELRGIEATVQHPQIVDAGPIFAGMRMVKDADELAAMRTAVRIIEQALAAAIGQVRAGMTERQLAQLWEQEVRRAGSAPAFDLIVASGPNAANPHHSNSDRAFQPGDLIIMDGGALCNGYASDITRTIALGEPSAEARRIYELVKAANQAGRATARPGISGEAIDQAARAVIEAGNYGPQFLHRTGHGLGLDVHEAPFIVAGSRNPLQPGTTFTIEPGVYVPGLGGVRIEDDVVLTADGAESLTSLDRELIVVAPSGKAQSD